MAEKTFLTIDELITNIRFKNINIKNEDDVRNILETNNYYFIMGYKFAFKNNDEICVRFEERNLLENELTSFNVFLEDYADAHEYYNDPAIFRYTSSGTYAYGTFTQLAYAWAVAHSSSTEVPSGWLLALPFVRDNAHVRLIVPSKMGISESQSSVIPYYYDIRSFAKAK